MVKKLNKHALLIEKHAPLLNFFKYLVTFKININKS